MATVCSFYCAHSLHGNPKATLEKPLFLFSAHRWELFSLPDQAPVSPAEAGAPMEKENYEDDRVFSTDPFGQTKIKKERGTKW